MGVDSVISILSSVGMAVGPPLVYVDQAVRIVRQRDSSGFSQDVCGVVIIANIVRVFFWLGARFETPLLVQSLLLIMSHLALLQICLHYAPRKGRPEEESMLPPSGGGGVIDEPDAPAARPFRFWQWVALGSYLEFLAALIIVLALLQLVLGRFMWYIDALGFVALTLESTLPIPQFISNYRRKSCYGFSPVTLAGWLFGDSFKTGYYFLRHNPLQFKVTGIMTLCWDFGVLAQWLVYGSRPPFAVTG